MFQTSMSFESSFERSISSNCGYGSRKLTADTFDIDENGRIKVSSVQYSSAEDLLCPGLEKWSKKLKRLPKSILGKRDKPNKDN